MKPEPLSKILSELIEGFVDDYEKGYVDRDDLIDGLATHIELEVKKRVEWLLKEIDKKRKEMLKYNNTSCGACYVSCLLFVEDLIKKAFEGVVE